MFDLLRRHLRTSSLTSVLIAVLVAATVFVIAAAPRALIQLGTAELRYELNEQPPARIDFSGTGPVTFANPSATGTVDMYLGATRSLVARLPSKLSSPLADGARQSAWLIRTLTARAAFADTPTTVLAVRLAIDLSWTDRVRVVAGKPPVAWHPSEDADPPRPIEIALSQKVADAMSLTVGDQLATDLVPYLVSEIYEPVDDKDTYWTHARDLEVPSIIQDPGSPLKIQASAFVAPESVAALRDEFAAGELSAWISIDPDAYDFADIDSLGQQVRKVTATPVELPNGGQLNLRSELGTVFTAASNKVAATSALVALTGSGFIGVLVATYALSIQALIARRRTALALASARGASALQLRAVMTMEAALIALPGSVLAIALAAILLPVHVGWDGWVAPAVVALIPIGLAVALTQGQADREAARDDLGGRSSGTARWVAEVAVLALAVLAVYLLQRRGLVASSAVVGIDPLLAATPLLLASVVGLAVIRIYHLPLHAIHRWLRPRIAAASVVGSARAVREPAVRLVGTLALVVGISIVVFTTGMISTVSDGLRESARAQVGADMQIAARNLPATLVADLDALPEIAGAVSLVSKSGVEFSDEASGAEVTVVLADTAALHLVRPDIPDISGKADGRLRILISSDWFDRIDGTELNVVNSRATSEGSIAADALPGVTRRWILVDSAAKAELNLDGQSPTLVLASIVPGVSNTDAVAAATRVTTAAQPDEFAGTVRVNDAQSSLQQLRRAPVVSGLERSLVLAAGAALLLTMLIVILSALSAAASRNRVVGVLRILGMNAGQIRRIVAWEFAPVTAAAVVVGAGLGLVLPYLITSVLDLSAFVGGTRSPSPSIHPLWIAVVVGVFVVAVIAAAVGATAAGRRFAPAGTLKMGEQ